MFSLATVTASFLATAVIARMPVNAQTIPPPFKLLFPTIEGSGCRANTSFAQLASDGQSVSILLSHYAAMTNETHNRVRQACGFALPIEAVPGKSVGLYQVDFRGWAYVPDNQRSYGRFRNEYFFAGQRGPVSSKQYGPGADEPIYTSTTIEVQSVIWSPCGGSTNFRINSDLIAYRGVEEVEQVQMQIDSMDATANGQVQVFVDSRDCTPAPTPTPTRLSPIMTPAPSTPTRLPTPAPTIKARMTPLPVTSAPTAAEPTTPASTTLTPASTAPVIPPPSGA
jgi:hypothetical protein